MQIFLVLNGQSAGPFDESQVRAMMAAGQAGPETQCCPVGEQAWRPLGSVLGGGPSAMLPTPYGGVSPPTNGLAITSLILGCSAFLCCVTGIPAAICGHVALGQIKRSGGTQIGGGLAVAGLVLGYLATAVLALYFVGMLAGVALPAFSRVQTAAREARCLSEARQIVGACRMYASDNDGKFPARLDDLFPTYLTDRKILLCPLKKDGVGSGYEYYGGKDDDPGDKVLLRSRDLGPSGRHIVIHVDQSAEKFSEDNAPGR